MITQEIKLLIRGVIVSLQKNRIFPEFEIPEIVIDCPINRGHGDYSTGIVLKLGKYFSQEAVVTAKVLRDKLSKSELFSNVEVAGPGFINFFISSKYLHNKIKEVLKQKEKFGVVDSGNNRKINVEFISANPTGPLTLGNGRGGFCGDTLARVLSKAGYKVTKEYYINDRGEQIIKLGHSVLKDEQAVYKGEYIEELNKQIGGKSPEEVGDKAVKYILEKMLKPAVSRMGIKFDVWFSEKKLYNDGRVDKTIADLTRRGFTYKSEGAVWFKSKALGDDKDRVLIRKDGVKTYFASDIAYLKNKINRGFEKIILFVGADHHGYINRLKAAGHTLSFNRENIDVVVMQLVALFKNGKEVRMSKRAGTYITLDELLDEVSLDAARFFFLQRASTTHLNFDMDLAKEKSQKNPIYYIQYAHARICSILRKSRKNFQFSIFNFQSNSNLQLLKDQAELNLINNVIGLPEVVQEVATDYQVQKLTQYATELADAFHNFYENCKVITKDKKLSSARLSLILATKIALKNTLDLMGISSPKKM